jgi:anaphase-promoting complex subunit 2
MYSLAVAEYMIPVLSQSGQVREYRGRKHTVSSSKPFKLARTFSKSLHAIFLDSFPPDKLQEGFIDVTFLSCCSIFRLNSTRGSSTASKYEVRHESSLRLMQLFENLKDVGLGGDPAVRAFAQAMENVVNKFVYSVWMEVDWANQQPVIANLIVWIEKAFAPFVKKAVTCLTGEEDARLDEEETQWLSMAISWLGKSRIEDLFRYVCWWPQSLGAILDLKVCCRSLLDVS